MPRQFDIHANPSPRSRSVRPYLLVLQSNRFGYMDVRLVAVLVRRSALPRLDSIDARLAPAFEVGGETVFLNPFEVTPVPAKALGPPVATLVGDEAAQRRVQVALDEVLGHS